MVTLPHIDTSESRYAEISRKMVETGDWITPQFDYGIPFWAKPPLSMWMSAAGMEIFGTNEFGSRIVIFLTSLGVLAIVARAARREMGATTGLVAAAILMGMPLFFYCSAAVMTDLALALGTTLAMTSFRAALLEKSRLHGYLFFTGLAIGLLAKGPLALVLIAPPVFGWTLLGKRWREVWRSIPWFTGTLLMLALALPWYIAAEHKTPGFLDYFILGEHWKRFVVRGWQGDLYGNAHSETPGTIWLHLLMVTFPWCLGLLALPFRRWREAKALALANDGRVLYWALFAIWPIVFFTPCRNIIATYPLPALPPLALLLAELAGSIRARREPTKRFHPFHRGLVIPCAAFTVVAAGVCALAPSFLPKRNEREIVQGYESRRSKDDKLVYFGARRYSAEFYSGGKAGWTESVTVVQEKLDARGRLYVAATERNFGRLPSAIQQRLQPVMKRGAKETTLYMEREEAAAITGIEKAKNAPSGG